METSKLLDAEIQVLFIRMLSELSENFNNIKKGMETIKKEPVRNEGHTN